MKLTLTLLFSIIYTIGFSQSKTHWMSDTTILKNGNMEISTQREITNKRQTEVKTYIYNKCGDKISFEHQKFRTTKNRVDYVKNRIKSFESTCE